MLYKEVCMRNDLFDEDFEINNENLTELKLRCFNQDYEAMYLLAKYYLKNNLFSIVFTPFNRYIRFLKI